MAGIMRPAAVAASVAVDPSWVTGVLAPTLRMTRVEIPLDTPEPRPCPPSTP